MSVNLIRELYDRAMETLQETRRRLKEVKQERDEAQDENVELKVELRKLKAKNEALEKHPPYYFWGVDVAAEADKTVAWTYTRGAYPLPHVTCIEDPAEFAAAWAKYREPKLPRGVRTEPYHDFFYHRDLLYKKRKSMHLGRPVYWTE